MNVRDRIIEALAEAEAQPVINIPDLADAVLAVLPDLLTDPEVVAAAASELRRWEVEAVTGINYDATASVTQQVLAAAAKALTGDAP